MWARSCKRAFSRHQNQLSPSPPSSLRLRFKEFRDELRDLPLGPGGSLQRLSNIAQYLFDREKPSLNYQSPTKKGSGIISNVRGKVSKLFGPLQVIVEVVNKQTGVLESYVSHGGGFLCCAYAICACLGQHASRPPSKNEAGPHFLISAPTGHAFKAMVSRFR